MDAGAVWKVGATINPEGRYSNAFLDRMYLRMETEFIGSHISVLAAEKFRLIGYAISHGNLPPGNCICK